MITTRVGCRVDLAGGTLDIWPLGLLHPGARTINVALDLDVTVTLAARESGYEVRLSNEPVFEAAHRAGLLAGPSMGWLGAVLTALDLGPCAISLQSASPRGGGLGASSALTLGLVVAARELFGRHDLPTTATALATYARDLEVIAAGKPTGSQDFYPGLLGGALEIRYGAGEDVVRRLEVDLDALGRSLVVAYSGASHVSTDTNWAVVRRRLDGDAETTRHLQGIGEAATEVAGALNRGDLAAAGQWIGREWEHRRELAPGVSTPRVEQLLDAARLVGAWGGKACGAGGGGSVAVLCPAERRSAVVSALREAGGQVLAAAPTTRGLVIERGIE